MPARINRRQQRELEELEAFAKSASLESTDDENSTVKNKGVFSVVSVRAPLSVSPFFVSLPCMLEFGFGFLFGQGRR